MRAHGAGAEPRGLGNLRLLQPHDVPEYQHLTLAAGQAAEPRDQGQAADDLVVRLVGGWQRGLGHGGADGPTPGWSPPA